MTSTAAVGAVKRRLDAAKAGHGGTLDPFATGILPIALGEATKTVSYVMDGVKRYHFTVRWGIATDTEDRDGAVTEESNSRPDRDAIEAVLSRFIGEIEQIPPAYSAIKLGGKRAYDLARSGEKPEMPPRMVTIDELRLLEMPDADHATFEAVCGKGTYIRALARGAF
jgi:tRNA pseudouridine55 synthase